MFQIKFIQEEILHILKRNFKERYVFSLHMKIKLLTFS